MSRLAVICVVVSVLAFAAFGCGSSSPTSPSQGIGNPQPQTAAQGATLTGRFLGSGSSRMQRALVTDVDDLTVSVLDGAIEVGSVDVENGSFTLRGLPEGTLTLVFKEGSVEVDRLTIEGVKVNQQIVIVVELVNGEVNLLEETRNGIGHGDIEIEGTAQNIQVGDHPMTGSLVVNGYTVVTRAAETTIRKGNRALTLDDLHNGDQVHVKGEFEQAADGSSQVFAREIKLQVEEEEVEDTPQNGCSFEDPSKPGKILICHKGKTLSVSPDAWSGHAVHGDGCGPCT